jgi:prephenate dehydrogenase
MSFEQITIVGVGLIGGSVGLAAKARGVARRVIGVGRETSNLVRAVELGAIDLWTIDLSEAVAVAQLVVICTPVDRIAEIILQAAPKCRPNTLFTDGGSTKGNIVDVVAGKLPLSIEYVPAHPLAGSEKSGVENARSDLFVERTTVVTPTADNSPAAIEQIVQFWRALGSTVTTMTPHLHDRSLAVTSHLPHAIAAAVAASTPLELLSLTAGGFRDVTRIASGDPQMWTAIFQANRKSVLAAFAAYNDQLSEFQRLLEAGDGAGLVHWLTEAKQVRDALGYRDSATRP